MQRHMRQRAERLNQLWRLRQGLSEWTDLPERQVCMPEWNAVVSGRMCTIVPVDDFVLFRSQQRTHMGGDERRAGRLRHGRGDVCLLRGQLAVADVSRAGGVAVGQRQRRPGGTGDHAHQRRKYVLCLGPEHPQLRGSDPQLYLVIDAVVGRVGHTLLGRLV
jgi:hypothetical protein